MRLKACLQKNTLSSEFFEIQGGVLPEKLGGGVWPKPQNPSLFMSQSMRFPTLFNTRAKHKTQFMTQP